MADTIVDLRMSRRGLIKLGGAAAVATTGAAGAMWPIEAQLKELEHQGWSRHPLACCMCGAFCGLVAMKKIGEPTSEKTVRIFPNPDHPQRGYCGRAAATMWIWNHPLRIRKPLKRVGERGEGKFKEVSWDEALNDIAAKLKDVVAKHGEQSVVSTSHSFSSYSKWITFPLGSPNDIGHSSTCNSASIAGRPAAARTATPCMTSRRTASSSRASCSTKRAPLWASTNPPTRTPTCTSPRR